MNWREIFKQRCQQRDKIDKQIKTLESQRKKIGSSCPLTVISELISEQYNQVCRMEYDWLVLYKKTATKKQIQYKRHEVAHSIQVMWDLRRKDDGEVFYFAGVDHSQAIGREIWLPLPDDIDDIYKLLTTHKTIVIGK